MEDERFDHGSFEAIIRCLCFMTVAAKEVIPSWVRPLCCHVGTCDLHIHRFDQVLPRVNDGVLGEMREAIERRRC